MHDKISVMFQSVTLETGWHTAHKTIMSGCRDTSSGIFQGRDDGTGLGSSHEDAENGQIKENFPGKANRICS